MDEEFIRLFKHMVQNTDEIVKKLDMIETALFQIREILDGSWYSRRQGGRQ